MLKENVDICAIVIHSDTNVCITEGQFPSNLKKSRHNSFIQEN